LGIVGFNAGGNKEARRIIARIRMLNKEAAVVRMVKQTRNILLILIGMVSLTILTVYFFGVLLPFIKQLF